MSSLLPLKPTTSRLRERDAEPKLVDFTDAEADEILSAVSSETARNILDRIYEEPKTASDIAREIDSSIQNVSYHLDRLTDSGLVEVAETWYSGQGREMNVYAPVNGPLVLYAGAEQATPSLTSALQRVFGAVALVGLASAVVHSRWAPFQYERGATFATTEAPEPSLFESLLAFATGPGGFVLGIGFLLIGCWFVYWYVRSYRPYQRHGGNAKPV